MSGYELINITNYNPNHCIFKSGNNEREEITYWWCNNKDKCEAYKNNKCIMFNQLFGYTQCPYGKKEKIIGFTKKARKCGELERQAKVEYADKFYVLDEQTGFSKIGDYINLPIRYVYDVKNTFKEDIIDFWGNKGTLIDRKYFNANILKELCEFKPYPLFGYNEISDYQNKVIPEFLYKLRLYDKDLYKELVEIYPEAKTKIEKFSPVGKKALLYSLSNGIVKMGTHKCFWNGEIVEFLDNPVFFGEKGKYFMKPEKDVKATIFEEKTVNENTILIN